jgi:predicted secreted protein
MDWFTGIIAYLLIWWTALFTVLPLWVKPAERQGGNMAGAPENPLLFKKFLVTTGLSAMIWLALFVAIKSNLIDFRAQSVAMKQEDEVK